MDFSPLIPENEHNHDVTSILREAFQEFLPGDFFPKEISDNTCKANLQGNVNNLSRSGQEVKQAHEEDVNKHKRINKTEDDIMEKVGASLIVKEEIQDDFPIIDAMKLKSVCLVHDPTLKDAKKYGLIRKEDLLKNKIEQSIDFQYNPFLHNCKKCTDEVEEHDVKEYRKHGKERIKPHENGMRKEQPKVVFIAKPGFVIFYNYRTNKIYKDTLRLVNISPKTQVFRLRTPQKDSCFSVELSSPHSRLAPGMQAEFIVTFKAKYYRDYKEMIIFESSFGNADVRVLLISYRYRPALTGYVFRSLSRMLVSSLPGDREFKNERRAALNHTIDCGTCYVGQKDSITLILMNEGLEASFFFITEDDWNSCSSTQLNSDMVLRLNGFKIYPMYFSIESGEFAEISIEIAPKSCGLYTEQLLLMCSNNTYETLELTCDGVPFDTSCFYISVLESVDGKMLPLIENAQKSHCFLGYLKSTDEVNLVITVNNKSQMSLNYYWMLRQETNSIQAILPIQKEWIHFNVKNQILPASCVTDFQLDIRFETEISSYYNTYLSLVVQNVPISSIVEGFNFTVIKTAECGNVEKFADIRLCEIEVACHLEVEGGMRYLNESDDVKSKAPDTLQFITKIIEFGVIPANIVVHKTFEIQSTVHRRVAWRVAEIGVDVDNIPAMTIYDRRISKTCGIFSRSGETCDICYEVDAKVCGRFVSILLLFELTESEERLMDNICIVVYEVADYNIFIHMTESYLPILSPSELLYVNTPHTEKIYVHNASSFIGYFCFLKPFGIDKDAVSINFEPNSGILPAGECQEIDVEIVPLREGIHHNIYVPCSIGSTNNLLVLRVMCAADGVSVYIYLPRRDGYYTIILWPKYTRHAAEVSELSCSCGECYVGSINAYSMCSIPEDCYQTPEQTAMSLDLSDTSTKPLVVLPDSNIISELKDAFGDDLILMNNVIEKHTIQIRTPTSVKFYFDNLTPLCADFTVESTNFRIDEDDLANPLNAALIKLKMKSADQEWDELCNRNHGLIVFPEEHKGKMLPKSLVNVDLLVYANTWGIYMEEIVLEIGDLNPFVFTLILEVVGAPLEFPFALNTICDIPTLRFGHIWYSFEQAIRQVKITNRSAVPIYVSWHVFELSPFDCKEPFNFIIDIMERNGRQMMESYLTNEYHGCERASCFEVEPREMKIEQKSSTCITVKLNPMCYELHVNPMDVRAQIVGYAHPDEEYRSKLNYFTRKLNLEPIKMLTLAALELPKLNFNLVNGTTKLIHYVNQLLFEKTTSVHVTLCLRNNYISPVVITFHIDPPFEIISWNTLTSGENTNVRQKALVKSEECVQITLKCDTSFKYLMDMAQMVYETSENQGEEEEVDMVERIITIKRPLRIIYENYPTRQVTNMKLTLIYPRIDIKPDHIDFGYIHIGQTVKKHLEIYNMTGYPIKFEIYKTCNNFEVVVKPHYAKIPGKTGMNESFVTIAVYFTPMECRPYLDSLRIYTNILTYYVDIGVWGSGLNDEKFDLCQRC